MGRVAARNWVDVTAKSLKERQTYYRPLDYLTKRFVAQEYGAGNENNTVAFLQYSRPCMAKPPASVITWDGVIYHRSAVVQQFLAQLNGGLSPDHWKITCIRLAPNAPEQNPVEDVGYKPSSSFANMPDCADGLGRSSFCFTSLPIVKFLIFP
jgi:transposase